MFFFFHEALYVQWMLQAIELIMWSRGLQTACVAVKKKQTHPSVNSESCRPVWMSWPVFFLFFFCSMYCECTILCAWMCELSTPPCPEQLFVLRIAVSIGATSVSPIFPFSYSSFPCFPLSLSQKLLSLLLYFFFQNGFSFLLLCLFLLLY